MSRWLELSTLVEPEAVDAVAEVFARWGQGVAIEEPLLPTDDPEVTLIDPARPVQVRTYLPLDERAEERRTRIAEAVWHLGQIRRVEPLAVRTLDEADWANAWKEHFYVHRVGERTVVVPTWREYQPEPGDVVVLLDPGMAFGTGLHPTTRLCLRALERATRPGARVLDLGTGSGILAIAAAQLGAGRVLALDLDPVAVRVAAENVARNRVADRVVVRQGTVADAEPHAASAPLDSGPFDLVVANISATVVLSLAAPLAALVRPSGRAIVSGLLAERADDVRAAYQASGWRPVEAAAEGDWVALTFERVGS